MKKGFSLIELMVVVVIIGILAAIAIPNFIRLKDRAKDSEVKANAHTIQIGAEDYAALEDGMYSGDVSQIELPANMKNPFDGTTGDGNAYDDGTQAGNEGIVGYAHASGYNADPYTIYANGKDGNLILTLSAGQ